MKHVEIRPADVALCEGRPIVRKAFPRLGSEQQRLSFVTGNPDHENPIVDLLRLDLGVDALETIFAAVVVT